MSFAQYGGMGSVKKESGGSRPDIGGVAREEILEGKYRTLAFEMPVLLVNIPVGRKSTRFRRGRLTGPEGFISPPVPVRTQSVP